MDAQFKTSDGTQINFEKSAEVVKYGGQTLKNVLDTLTGFKVSEYGGKLLKVKNADELRHALKITESFAYDEADKLFWRKGGNPSKSSNGLAVSAANTLSSSGFELGGDPFTIEFNAKIPSNAQTGYVAFSAGNLSVQFGPANNISFFVNGARIIFGSYDSGANFSNFEFGYDGSMIHAFVNGSKKNTSSNPGNVNIPRGIRAVTLGGASGYYKFLRISDGVCRHTANFSPQTPALDQYTVSLLRF